jgi:glycosyltransferase involved in cell wall biosynthesis
MTNPPKISIVTPSFNQGAFIADAIESVMRQRYPSVEHIVVDNCSTDETLETLGRYRHLVWVSEPDLGQSDALNKGFKMATGDIIGWLNADDYYLPGAFQKATALLAATGAAGVYSNLVFVSADRSPLRMLVTHRPVKWMSLFHCYIPSATFFFNRQILDAGLRMDPRFDITMDKEFFAHILHAGYELVYANDVFAAFRWHGGNKSVDSLPVKLTRYGEGLKVLNRYGPVRFPTSLPFVAAYAVASTALLGYRRLLKMRPRRVAPSRYG